MKVFLRYFFFTLIAFYFTQVIYFPFILIDEVMGTLYLLGVMASTTFFSRTFLKIIRMPHTGIGFYILNVFIHFLAIYMSVIYLKKFQYFALNLEKYDIFGIISTPEVFLEKYTSLLMFCAIYCLIFGILYFSSWTHTNKK